MSNSTATDASSPESSPVEMFSCVLETPNSVEMPPLPFPCGCCFGRLTLHRFDSTDEAMDAILSYTNLSAVQIGLQSLGLVHIITPNHMAIMSPDRFMSNVNMACKEACEQAGVMNHGLDDVDLAVTTVDDATDPLQEYRSLLWAFRRRGEGLANTDENSPWRLLMAHDGEAHRYSLLVYTFDVNENGECSGEHSGQSVSGADSVSVQGQDNAGQVAASTIAPLLNLRSSLFPGAGTANPDSNSAPQE